MLPEMPESILPVDPVVESRDIRKLGINPHHWYVVARSSEVTNKPMGLTIWKQSILLYRDHTGTVYALEDRCSHRQVKLSHGQVMG